MAIVDVTVIPIGTETPSVSDYVAELQGILQKHQDEGTISFILTPMSTLIEGELTDLFRVVQEIHEAPFSQGIQRVATNIRIDDRRDKKRKMEDKLASVESKLSRK
ncbi:MTH1187 family thiamine-binding protein [Bacillus sp. AK031]